MAKDLEWFKEQGQITLDESMKRLYKRSMDKARNNLITMTLLLKIEDGKSLREQLSLPKEYSADEWAVISGYYAMYAASLSLLAKIGIRSKNHTATMLALEKHFVEKSALTKSHLSLIKQAGLRKEELDSLSDARQKREIAQYSITKATTRAIAEKIKKDAVDYVNICEEIVR